MRKFYENKPVLFAVLWIVAYVVLMAPLRGSYGDGSLQMLLGLVAISGAMLSVIRLLGIEKELGMTRWLQNGKKLFWLLPMWVLSTGNLWGGAGLRYDGITTVMAVLSFLLVGVAEEIVFRGFLFNGMKKTGSLTVAIVVSAITFGMGHIVNLLTGHATAETLVQMVFAVAWGFLLTFAYLKGGSLLPCIVIHGLIDAFSVFARDNEVAHWAYVIATVAVAVVYCLYLRKQPTPEPEQ
ncbi:MAG: CPBP family intramembrane metalloprotease [Clostridia bacterium]|nr:CPBP family intramembrane metalloprotease [Clostridia bacterium]